MSYSTVNLKKTEAEETNLPNFPAKFAKFCRNLKSLKYIKFLIEKFCFIFECLWNVLGMWVKK